MTYRITHDPESGAFYIRVREGEYQETVPLSEDRGLGASVDVDADGNVLGLEFLSFEEFEEVLAGRDGELDVPERLSFRSVFGDVEAQTRMEAEVLRLVAEGVSNPEIAKRLSIPLTTVRVHVNKAMRSLGAKNRDEVKARLADRLGLEGSRPIRPPS